MSNEGASRELTITRLVDAPRELVFRAWTDPEHLARWWGPDGFSVSSAHSDLRPGGALAIVMCDPDGLGSPMTGVYREVVVPQLLVIDTRVVGADGQLLLEGTHTVTLADRHGKTELTVRAQAVALAPEAIAMLGGMRAGWSQSLQCLDDLLTGTIDRQLVVSRLLEAPRAKVFELWTEPEHVGKWRGPAGFTISVDEMDVRPGGIWRFTMHGPDGTDYPNTIVYDEVSPPKRLVYTHREPLFQTTVTFDEMMGMTALSMRLVFGSAEELASVAKVYHAAEGANQTLDRLRDVIRAMAPSMA
jgi:uncharacterized protein YndB with AHSA1/START domain